MSQITKPMALDETLQDVVTAIQGITQGGMIVFTGTVGSAIQPVYINGGVPTAMTGALAAVNGGTGDIYGKAPYVYIGKVTDADIPVQGTAEVNRRTIVSLINGNANNHAPTPNNWYILYTSSGSDTGADYGSQIAVGVNVETIWYRIKHSGTWRGWHQIYGITTGTPTNINTHVSFFSGIVQKTGNIVCVNLVFKVTSAWSPASTTEVLCKLPFGSAVTGTEAALTRIHADADNANTLVGVAFVRTDGTVYIGTSPYNFVQNRYIRIYGTYMTND